MKRSFQIVLLKLYRLVVSTSVLSTDWGRSVYDWSYEWYKTLIEVGDLQVLRNLVTPGSIVVDVGANIGYFTTRFGCWVGNEGRVIAIEPEEVNFHRLERAVSRDHLNGVVTTVRAVAAETTGTLKLRINPYHPGDHRIADEGVEVKAYALDDLLLQLGLHQVSLIKIDVQGAEEKVLLGARRTLERFRPLLFIEIDDGALRSMGSSAKAIFDTLAGLGYQMQRFHRGQISQPLELGEALTLCSKVEYSDFLFTHQSRG